MEVQSEKRMFISEQQKQELIRLIENEEELRKGKFSSTFTFKIAQSKGQHIATILNSIPGAQKSWLQWKRTWQDLKRITKKKSGNIKKYSCGTGGVPSSSTFLTSDDEKILELVGSTAVDGDQHILESEVGAILSEVEIDLEENRHQLPASTRKLGQYENQENVENVPNKSNEAEVQVKPKKFKTLRARNLERSTEAAKAVIDLSKEDLITKKNYYEQKLEILKENLHIKREMLELRKEEVQVQKRIADILQELI